MFLPGSDPAVVFAPVPIPAPTPVAPPYTATPPYAPPVPLRLDPMMRPAGMGLPSRLPPAVYAPTAPITQQPASSSKPPTGMAYSATVAVPINAPPDATAATQLPTVTTWANVSGQWQLIAAIALAVLILVVAYRHSRD